MRAKTGLQQKPYKFARFRKTACLCAKVKREYIRGKGGLALRSACAKKKLLGWLLPVAIVVLSVLLLQAVFSQSDFCIQKVTPQDGVLDIRGTDVSESVLDIANAWDFYPEALYTSADFAAGKTAEKAAPGTSASEVSYGTHRLRILAEPNRYYAICGFSLDYASRVFVNGTEVAAFGRVADNAADFVPRVGYMTIPMFSGESGFVTFRAQKYLLNDLSKKLLGQEVARDKAIIVDAENDKLVFRN